LEVGSQRYEVRTGNGLPAAQRINGSGLAGMSCDDRRWVTFAAPADTAEGLSVRLRL